MFGVANSVSTALAGEALYATPNIQTTLSLHYFNGSIPCHIGLDNLLDTFWKYYTAQYFGLLIKIGLCRILFYFVRWTCHWTIFHLSINIHNIYYRIKFNFSIKYMVVHKQSMEVPIQSKCKKIRRGVRQLNHLNIPFPRWLQDGWRPSRRPWQITIRRSMWGRLWSSCRRPGRCVISSVSKRTIEHATTCRPVWTGWRRRRSIVCPRQGSG